MLKLLKATLYKFGVNRCKTGKPPAFNNRDYLLGYSRQYEKEQKITAIQEAQNV